MNELTRRPVQDARLPMHKKRGNLAFTVSYSMAKDSKNKSRGVDAPELPDRPGRDEQWVSLGLALPSRHGREGDSRARRFVKSAPHSVHVWGGPAVQRT